jgi:hypothetical protein
MPEMTPALAPQQVSPVREAQFDPKPPATPPGDRVAVLVIHGMGQQVPYETIEDVAKAVWRGAAANSPQPSIRSVRLGTGKPSDAEPQFMRAEFTIPDQVGRTQDVHIYEAYWAPLTEGKVSIWEVISFLFDAGWNGILNTTHRTFRRWMFGAERKFNLPTERLTLAFLFVMALLASLSLFNAVLAASAASHVIGSDKPFPTNGLLLGLTWDFVIADAGILLIILGIFLFGRSELRPIRWFAWLLIFIGALGIIVAALFMLGHLAGCQWMKHFTPGEKWARLINAHLLGCLPVVLLFWGAELLAAHKVRWFLIEYVGDVTAYIAAHTVSRFWDLRHQIWETAMGVARAVYQARTADDSAFLYPKVIVVGHSLGSVIGYDVLNGMFLQEGFETPPNPPNQPLDIANRTRMFLTFGSPLDKTAFLFRTQQDMKSPVREVAAAAVQPMIQSYNHRPREWVNLWSSADIICGHLDFYDPPTEENVKVLADAQDANGVALVPNLRAVNNIIDPAAHTPLLAHVEYWKGKLFASALLHAITAPQAVPFRPRPKGAPRPKKGPPTSKMGPPEPLE